MNINFEMRKSQILVLRMVLGLDKFPRATVAKGRRIKTPSVRTERGWRPGAQSALPLKDRDAFQDPDDKLIPSEYKKKYGGDKHGREDDKG